MALIQKRKLGESVVVQDPDSGRFVKITVQKIIHTLSGGKVELAFEDPERSYNIYREDTVLV